MPPATGRRSRRGEFESSTGMGGSTGSMDGDGGGPVLATQSGSGCVPEVNESEVMVTCQYVRDRIRGTFDDFPVYRKVVFFTGSDHPVT